MGLLDERVAIVTGASKGLGRVIALQFASEGAAVVCAARSADLVAETAEMIAARGGRAVGVICDAAREDAVRRMVETGVGAFGKIDTLINNAGDSGPFKPVQDYSTEEWYSTIDSCLTSAYMCIRFAVPHMIAAGGGTIVNISSLAGRRGQPLRIGYCSAKAGVIGMVYGLAWELAPHGINVHAVVPGPVEGDRMDRVIAGQASARGISLEEARRFFVARSPMNRMSTPEDIARLAVFLCSSHCRSLSGQSIAVSAGEPGY